MNAMVERILCCILFLLVVLGVIVMHIDPEEDEEIVETQESTIYEEKETVIAPLIESKESEIIGGYRNGMPCEVNKVPEESEEETNEPETREEAKQETESTAPASSPQGTTAPVVGRGCGGTDGNTVGEDPSTTGETVEEQTETEGASSIECVEEVESDECSGEMASSLLQQPESTEGCNEIPVIPYYSVNGAILDLDIQRHLYQRLSEKGIEWFMPYAIMIAYQESRFNPRAENRNGLDKGLFQYRITYYSGGDIFNPYEQIDIFTQQMANRANAGCSINEMISRHMMSDYGAYNQTYVDQVLQHQAGLTLISN